MERRDFLKKAAMLFGVVSVAGVLSSCEKLSGTTYSVNSSKCTGCQKCLSVCGASAISFSNNKASISSSKCTGCAHCVRVCSAGAIS